MRHPTHHVVMLGYPGAQILDITGPLEVFSRTSRLLNDERRTSRPAYDVELVAHRPGPLRTSSGLSLIATRAIADVRRADTLLVTGGVGFREAARNPDFLGQLRRLAGHARRVGSICNGAVVLAAAGLLKGRPATTHWAYGGELLAADPTIRFDPDPIYVRSGRLYTSAGVTAGMDMALGMVEEDWGRAVAIRVAQALVMFLKRPGGQAQFSRLLVSQAAEASPFEALGLWIQEHLDDDLRVPLLARKVHMSPRHFARRFRDECGATPMDFVEQLRIEAARRQLEDTGRSIKEVAQLTGFGREQRLTRAFRRRTGVSPRDYRNRFAGHEA